MGNKYFYRDRLTIFNFFFSLSLFNLFPRWSIDDDKYNNLSDPLYIFQWKISEYSKRPIFDRSINFKTRSFFKQALSISSFFGKIAHASSWIKATCRDRSTRANQFSYTTGAPSFIQQPLSHSLLRIPLPSLPSVLSLSSVPSSPPPRYAYVFESNIPTRESTRTSPINSSDPKRKFGYDLSDSRKESNFYGKISKNVSNKSVNIVNPHCVTNESNHHFFYDPLKFLPEILLAINPWDRKILHRGIFRRENSLSRKRLIITISFFLCAKT